MCDAVQHSFVCILLVSFLYCSYNKVELLKLVFILFLITKISFSQLDTFLYET